MTETVSVMGHRVARVEDPRFLTTGGIYGADVVLPSSPGFIVFVRSVYASGSITSIDTNEAANFPGVIAVVTAADLTISALGPPFPMIDAAMGRPLLASDRVRFVGEPVVAVIADSLTTAVDAAEFVFVDIEPDTALIDARTAAEPDSPRVFADGASNVAFAVPAEPIDFSGCHAVVTVDIVNQRLSGAPIEPRAASAYWDGDHLVQWASSQSVHVVQASLMQVYGLPADRVRVINADVGGAFGVRGRPGAEELLLPELARIVGQPVRWVETRSESFAAMGHGRAQHQHVMLGGDADGRLTHYKLDMVQEVGAYPSVGAILPMATGVMGAGPYDVANLEISFRSVVTNTSPVVAYRGAGRPEATGAIERAIDLFAQEVGLDAVEIRRRNFVADDAFPFPNQRGVHYDIGRYSSALDLVLEASGYDALVAERTERIEAGAVKRLGIGIASYVEITGGATGGTEHGRVNVNGDGTVDLFTGSTPTGQGHETSWAMLVADRMQVPMSAITVHFGDTDVIPSSEVTGGSRSLQIAGAAAADAAEHVVDLGRRLAADRLEAAVDDVVLDAAGFHVIGSPVPVLTWSELVDAEPVSHVSELAQEAASFPFGSHVAVVEVDIETGQVALLRLVACDDAGTLLNPLLAEGQIHGGIAQGIAQALFEEVVYDQYGNLTTATFMDYMIPSAPDMPSFETVATETPTPLNPLGAKGIGESGSIGSTAAVHNAVLDALRPFGVKHLDMPLGPHKILKSMNP